MASRAFCFLLIALGIIAIIPAAGSATHFTYNPAPGFVYASPFALIAAPVARIIIGILLTAAVAWTMEEINRVFNLLRTPTILFIGLFVILQFATPTTPEAFISGIFLNLVILGVLATFYASYMKRTATRRIFLAFCCIAAASLFDYSFAFFIPPFALGLSQMRCADSRMLIAMALGIITPWWICWGVGCHGGQFTPWPSGVSIFTQLPTTTGNILFIITIAVTVITSLALCASNMLKIYNYNARSRALSGLMMMLTLWTSILILVNVSNAPAYLSLLNCLLAYQLALFFHTGIKHRAYILIIATIVVFTAIYLCNILL